MTFKGGGEVRLTRLQYLHLDGKKWENLKRETGLKFSVSY